MKQSNITGVFKQKNKIFTENPKSCKGIKVYNEHLVKNKEKEYRSWNPYRSKLAAAINKGTNLEINTKTNILYLGAATGTTVSHLSDILTKSYIYAVENSPIAITKLIQLCEKRKNIIPIFEDANHPERYNHIVPQVEMIYQDISQRNQAEIFIENINKFLKNKGTGILMVKARSIDVSIKPEKVYENISKQLQESKMKIKEIKQLKPYEKDHAAIIITN